MFARYFSDFSKIQNKSKCVTNRKINIDNFMVYLNSTEVIGNNGSLWRLKKIKRQ